MWTCFFSDGSPCDAFEFTDFSLELAEFLCWLVLWLARCSSLVCPNIWIIIISWCCICLDEPLRWLPIFEAQSMFLELVWGDSLEALSSRSERTCYREITCITFRPSWSSASRWIISEFSFCCLDHLPWASSFSSFSPLLPSPLLFLPCFDISCSFAF